MAKFDIIFPMWLFVGWVFMGVMYLGLLGQCRNRCIQLARKYERINCSIVAAPQWVEVYDLTSTAFMDLQQEVSLGEDTVNIDDIMSAVIVRKNPNFNYTTIMEEASFLVYEKYPREKLGRMEIVNTFVGICEDLCSNRFNSLPYCMASQHCNCPNERKQATTRFCKAMKDLVVTENFDFMKNHCNCLHLF